MASHLDECLVSSKRNYFKSLEVILEKTKIDIKLLIMKLGWSRMLNIILLESITKPTDNIGQTVL